MTAMPQMVSLFNGMGGACALFISLAEEFEVGGLRRWRASRRAFAVLAYSLSDVVGDCLGRISFTGSLVAFGKLQGLVSEKPLRWPTPENSSIVALVARHSRRGDCVLALQPYGATLDYHS